MNVPLRAENPVSRDFPQMDASNDNEPLDGSVNVGNVVQDEPGQLLVLFLADMTDETLAS